MSSSERRAALNNSGLAESAGMHVDKVAKHAFWVHERHEQQRQETPGPPLN
jgi:hypothetical protein